jgi:hypothetical protein
MGRATALSGVTDPVQEAIVSLSSHPPLLAIRYAVPQCRHSVRANTRSNQVLPIGRKLAVGDWIVHPVLGKIRPGAMTAASLGSGCGNNSGSL